MMMMIMMTAVAFFWLLFIIIIVVMMHRFFVPLFQQFDGQYGRVREFSLKEFFHFQHREYLGGLACPIIIVIVITFTLTIINGRLVSI
jgi:hypothetical protein